MRQAWTISDAGLIAHLRSAAAWPQLTTLVKVQAERRLGDETAHHTRYDIASAAATTEQFLTWTRTH